MRHRHPSPRRLLSTAASTLLALVVAAAPALAQSDGDTAASGSNGRTQWLSLDKSPELIAQHVLGGRSEGGTPRLMDVATGDLDGDGIDDLVFGASGADPNDQTAAGSVYVVFGGADLLRGNDTLDLTLVESFDLRIDGVMAGARLGHRVAVADIDGDGFGDLVATAPGRRGAVYVKLGAASWPTGTLVIGPPDSYDVAFVGAAEGSLLGAELCVGDLDNDKRAELIFPAITFDEQTRQSVSTDLHIVPGRDDWQKQAYGIEGRLPGRARLTRRVAAGTRAVHTCAFGDLNDNGAGDVVAGMPFDLGGVDLDLEEAGTVTVIHDIMSYSGGAIDLASEQALERGFRIVGDQTGARFGQALAVGNFNGDLHDDLLVGAPKRLLAGPESEGAVHVFWGGLLPSGLTVQNPDLTIVGQGGGWGSVLEMADLNSDNRLDLLVGAPRVETVTGADSGMIDIFLGGPHLTDGDPGTIRRDKRIHGNATGERLGYAMATGDLDGDGATELVLRSAGNPAGRREAGSLHVVRSIATSLVDEAVLDELRPLVLLGPGSGGRLAAQALQRDLDGDGSEEFVFFSPRGGGDRGLVCVASSLSGTLDLARADNCQLRIFGVVGEAIASIDAGDLDGDGVLELFVGFEGTRNDPDHPGLVVAVALPPSLSGELRLTAPNKAGALPAVDAQTGGAMRVWLGGRGAEGLGARVIADDLDGDGRVEVIMGAARATWEDRPEAGAVIIARGQMEGLDAAGMRRAWDVAARVDHGTWMRFEGNSGARLGRGTHVVDFDGDGTRDLVLSAALATVSGEADRGEIALVYDVADLGAGTWNLADPDVISLRAVGIEQGSGLTVTGARDIDGDGTDDLLLVSPWEKIDTLQYGAGYVVYGDKKRRAGTVTLGTDTNAELRVVAGRGLRLTGLAVADVMGDAQPEILVTAEPHTRTELKPVLYGIDTSSTRPGGVLVLSREGTARWALEGHGAGTTLELLSPQLDADRDGRAELWLVEPTADASLTDQGAALRIELGDSLRAVGGSSSGRVESASGDDE